MASFNKNKKNPWIIPHPKGSLPTLDPLTRGIDKGGRTLPVQDTSSEHTPFVPGQSVQPGSIDMPQGDYRFTTGLTPESVWAPHEEMGYTLDYIYALLNNSNKGGSLSQGYADVLQQIIYDLQNNPKANINPDLVISLFQNLLSYQTTQEQRGYDYGMKQEQRLYDNPQNELARLMGAGISRDAAIQMLSGNSGSGAGASSPQTTVQSPVAGAGAANLNASNAHANLVGNIFNGVQLVANLMQQGFGIAQAIEQTEMLSMQNYMSSQQIQAYNGVNAITQAFNNAVTDGFLSIDEVQGLRTADDYYKWIIDHADSNIVKPLIQNGAIRSAFGSSIGRGMLNQHLEQTRLAKDSGTMFDNFLKQQKLQNALTSVQIDKVGAELNNINADTVFKNAQTEHAFAAITLIGAQTNDYNALAELHSAQINEVFAQTELFNAQTTGQGWTNENLRLQFELNDAGFPMLKQIYLDELNDKLLYWQTINDPQAREDRISAWFQDNRNQYIGAYVENLRMTAVGDFATECPNLWRLITAWNACGASTAVRKTAFWTSVMSKIVP